MSRTTLVLLAILVLLPSSSTGGENVSDRSINRGLDWLARHQNKDGSWKFDGADAERNDLAGATALALVAFLGAGEDHVKGCQYQKIVKMGLDWLLKDLPTNGATPAKFSHATSSAGQAIATLALCEAYLATKDKTLLAPAQAAIDYIQKTQLADGSWETTPINEDTSLICWQVQALEAAILCKDIRIEDKVIEKINAFLDATGGGKRKAVYGQKNATGAAPGTSLTAAGLLCRYYFDRWDENNAGMAEGVEGLMRHNPSKQGTKNPAFDMSYFYHATQVVYFFGGDEWRSWKEGPKTASGRRNGGLDDWLSELQRNTETDDTGSWDPDAGSIGKNWGRMGTTAICVMTLDVCRGKLLFFRPPVKNGGELLKLFEEIEKRKVADLLKDRNLRWVLRFKVASGEEYLNQLKLMEAEILVPIPGTDKVILIKDLGKPDEQKNGSADDFERLGKKLKFQDDRKEVVKAVAKILKVDQHAPTAFFAFFPLKLQDELAAKELSYRNRKVEDIEETIFRITVKDEKYEIQVVDQKLKK